MQSALVINYEYPPIGGGAANAAFHLALTMAQQGRKVSVLTSAYKTHRGRSVEDGAAVYRIPAFRKQIGRSSMFQMMVYVLSAIVHLPAVVLKEKPDTAIVFFSFPCGLVGLTARMVWHIPYVVMLRGGDVPGSDARLFLFHKLLLPVRRIIYKKSRAVIANSDGLRDLALKADPGFRIHVIENGVDTVFFTPSEYSGTDDRPYCFLFVGRFCDQKNIGTLIEAFSRCRQTCAAMRLVLIGDGPARSKLKRHAVQLGIDEYVEWPGWCTKETCRDAYRAADCFVNPSFNEGMPNAVLEAMACGLPVLGSDCTGHTEIIADGKNGYRFDPANPAALADRMSALVNNRELGRALGAQGRIMCGEKFSWRVAALKLISLLETGGTHSETV
jgi:glycosyltransferase involved in cell wall biosynthesis